MPGWRPASPDSGCSISAGRDAKELPEESGAGMHPRCHAAGSPVPAPIPQPWAGCSQAVFQRLAVCPAWSCITAAAPQQSCVARSALLGHPSLIEGASLVGNVLSFCKSQLSIPAPPTDMNICLILVCSNDSHEVDVAAV